MLFIADLWLVALGCTKVLLNQTHSRIRKVEQRCVFPVVSVVYSEQYQQSESNLRTRLFIANNGGVEWLRNFMKIQAWKPACISVWFSNADRWPLICLPSWATRNIEMGLQLDNMLSGPHSQPTGKPRTLLPSGCANGAWIITRGNWMRCVYTYIYI